MPKPLYNHSIIDHPMQCTCGWYGIIADCQFDDDGGIGCPVCSKIVSEQPGQDDLDDVDKSMIPGAWAAYNKLVEGGKIPRHRGETIKAYIHPTDIPRTAGLNAGIQNVS